MEIWLLAGAATLGLLAFFEPCTIATHTVFAARTHRGASLRRVLDLTLLWLTRSLLCVGLLLLAVTSIPSGLPGPVTAVVVLLVMGSVYLVSRYLYIPVPHLAFHRLLPGGARLPHAMQLGLTLPACTIPLFVVVAGLTAVVGDARLAVAAGVLFAGLFTLPTAWAGWNGISGRMQRVLAGAAVSVPVLTALLLFGAALLIVLNSWDLDLDAYAAGLDAGGIAALAIAFGAGVLFSFNPVAFGSIPVAIAYVTRARTRGEALKLGGAFVAGLVLTHVLLGVFAALAAGFSAVRFFGREWGLVLGPLLIVLGLIWAGWLRVRLPWFGLRGWRVNGPLGAFGLGVPFAVALCPFCTPALLVALTTAAAIGSVAFGAALLLAFGLGRAVPIALGAWSMAWLETLEPLRRHQRLFEILGALVLIAVGVYLIKEYLFPA
jgi:cytochrome c-type biogenesis protein